MISIAIKYIRIQSEMLWHDERLRGLQWKSKCEWQLIVMRGTRLS